MAALSVSLVSAPLRAQEMSEAETKAEAARLYNEAKRALSEERYRDAATNFEAASRLRPHAVALYTAAQAWELAGEQARAADAFALALATPKLNESQAARARERLDALEADLGVVSVLGEDTTRVQLDDHSEFKAPARLHAAGGSHVLLILRADGSVERRNIEVKAGDVLELDAEAKTEEQPKEEPKPKQLEEPKLQPVVVEEPKEESPWKTVGFISAGAGLASVLGGVLLGLSAKDAETAYNAGPTRESFDHAKGLQTQTNIMLIAGGVLTAAGITLIFWQPGASEGGARGKMSVGLGPAQLWAKGDF
ncbi:MAG: hypothetical protein KC766_08165 [Myxococcales bacterium]|nr:hypothetical protein [Myxococcales bacterium]